MLRVKDGVIDHIMLNEACSSGCGSFIVLRERFEPRLWPSSPPRPSPPRTRWIWAAAAPCS